MAHFKRRLSGLVGLVMIAGVVLHIVSAHAAPPAIDTPISNPPAVPVQLRLTGSFTAGSNNLTSSGLGPKDYTVPDGSSLLLRYISCVVFLAADQKVHIDLEANFSLPTVSGSANLVNLIIEAPVFSFAEGFPQHRRAANQPMHAYIGVVTPNGPTVGNTIRLQAQRSADLGTGSVECTIGGDLF
jgi:hypothetical protein